MVVIGATNRPAELDDAVRRRLTKRVYVPLPDAAGRAAVLKHLLQGQQGTATARLSDKELACVVRATEGYSASDLAALCKEAAMAPVRELGARIAHVAANQVRPRKGRGWAEGEGRLAGHRGRCLYGGRREGKRGTGRELTAFALAGGGVAHKQGVCLGWGGERGRGWLSGWCARVCVCTC